MHLTNKLSHEFGHLGVRIKNQITYSLSVFEQNPTQGTLKNGIPNLIRRFKTKFLMIAIPGIAYYGIYVWGSNTQAKLNRKNPKDYENDT